MGSTEQTLQRFVKGGQQIAVAGRRDDCFGDAEVELAADDGTDGEQMNGRLRQPAQTSLQNGANVLRNHVAIR